MNLKIIINIALLSFFILSCNNKKSDVIDSVSNQKTDFQNKISKINKVKFPLNSVKYTKCVKFDGTYNELDSTCITRNNDLLKFIKKSTSSIRDKNDFYLANEKKYFPTFRYRVNSDIYIIGFLVEYWLEDTKGVFIQLNSFDSFGKQIDYLIILNRFSNEGIFNKTDFNVSDNFKQIKLINIIEDKRKIIKKERIYTVNGKGFFKEKKNE